MAIYTRFGNEVTIEPMAETDLLPDTSDKVWVPIKYASDGEARQVLLNDLRATDGFNEIAIALKQATLA